MPVAWWHGRLADVFLRNLKIMGEPPMPQQKSNPDPKANMYQTPPRIFVPATFDATDVSQIQSLSQSLLDRPIDSPAALENWLADVSELTSVIDEFGTRRFIEKSCNTEDPSIEKAFLFYAEQIEPKFKPLSFAFQKKFLASPHRSALTGTRYQMLTRKWQADVEIFRDENVPLDVEITKLVNEYDKISAAMTVQFHGKEQTLQQLARYNEEQDRAIRQEAWEAGTSRRLADRLAIDSIFDRLLPLRQKIAQNAGCTDYRDYMWKSLKRFDYTPDDCLRFADAIAQTCVPVVDELNRQRASDLNLDRLRPWDLAVDPHNQPPLRPFAETQIDQFINRTASIFGRMHPQLAEDFESLRQNKNLDLASRRGKQPGGYQSTLEEVRQPFIFMNAAGLQRDVETLLHEGGHAFHSLATRDEPLIFLRSAPMEFCEVASMSMELLGSDHFDLFYSDPATAQRAKKNLIEGIIRFLPWMATIDSFQHWLYTAENPTGQARTSEWLGLLDRFAGKTDWTGYEAARAAVWQRQLHLFHVPFYYIEYGIAQLGALQFWLKSRHDPRSALANYRAALKLGGTRPLPDLFAAAGIRFDFSQQTLGPLMKAMMEELESVR
jgi:oligoendopeptidase F